MRQCVVEQTAIPYEELSPSTELNSTYPLLARPAAHLILELNVIERAREKIRMLFGIEVVRV